VKAGGKIDFQQTTQRNIPEDSTLHNHCCENLKSSRLKIVCDFRQRVSITRERRKYTVIAEPSGEGRLVVICFTPMTSKPHSCKPREIFSVEVVMVRCPITTLTGLSDLGYRVKWYKVFVK
jgi:hypothetical protein